jgi:hypothetical protein
MIAKQKGQPASRPREMHIKNNKIFRYSKSLAIKELERLADDEVKRKYPMIPYPAPRKFRDDTASGLTKAIITYLRLTGNQAERIYSTGRPLDGTKTFTDVLGNRRQIGRIQWIPGTSTNGTADISATVAGKSVKIEIKINDRQSPAQHDYQQRIEQAGGIYIICRSFQEFFDWYKQNFA